MQSQESTRPYSLLQTWQTIPWVGHQGPTDVLESGYHRVLAFAMSWHLTLEFTSTFFFSSTLCLKQKGVTIFPLPHLEKQTEVHSTELSVLVSSPKELRAPWVRSHSKVKNCS